jgi:regulatory protein
MRITSIDRPPRKQRYEVRLDHVLVVPLSPEVLAQANLRPGQDLSDAELKTLQQREARHSALAAALRALAYGPKSEKELRTALTRRCVRPDVLAETVARLKELRLLDDAEFARTYVELRDRTSPRGRRALRSELVARGIEHRSADQYLGGLDEADAAYRAASRRARSLPALPFAAFQHRLGDHLLRRGFTHETTRAIVRSLWEEGRRGLPESSANTVEQENILSKRASRKRATRLG